VSDFGTIHIDDDDSNATGTTGATGATDTPSPDRDRPPRSREMRRLQEQLADAYTQVGIILGIVGGRTGNVAGFIVARRGDVLAESWIDLAERDIRVKRGIQSILQVGGWSAVVAAHATVVLPIAAMAGVLPEPIAGKVMVGLAMQDPELFAQLSAQMASENGASAN
jgi:hypothetical protein